MAGIFESMPFLYGSAKTLLRGKAQRITREEPACSINNSEKSYIEKQMEYSTRKQARCPAAKQKERLRYRTKKQENGAS